MQGSSLRDKVEKSRLANEAGNKKGLEPQRAAISASSPDFFAMSVNVREIFVAFNFDDAIRDLERTGLKKG